ncbi:Ribosomal L1 domain-containing protein 1 [Myotis brandtii]|uniref:Ribosomal L1 domain-containing protein 1 n=1 Tax=Myotis brandtii TaxID=109478 RepID=S7N5E0_MYOBR|nr:Ribosomal L1 domain-containing protein 1 [Myotis brandtii]
MSHEILEAAEPKTPAEGPAKKTIIKEKMEKEGNSLLEERDPRPMPQRTEAKLLTTANKSAGKVLHSPHNGPQTQSAPVDLKSVAQPGGELLKITQALTPVTNLLQE